MAAGARGGLHFRPQREEAGIELAPQFGPLRLEDAKPLRQIQNEPAQGVGSRHLRDIIRPWAHTILNQPIIFSANALPGNLSRLQRAKEMANIRAA